MNLLQFKYQLLGTVKKTFKSYLGYDQEMNGSAPIPPTFSPFIQMGKPKTQKIN